MVMFGKIINTSENTVTIENLSGQIPLFLKGIHVSFQEDQRVIIGKIIEVKKEYFVIFLIGEIVNGVFITGIYKAPKLINTPRIVTASELETFIGKQDYHSKDTLLIGTSTLYDNFKVTVNLNDFLDEVSLIADISEHQDDDNVITLMTLHSAKGLEFPVVFIIGMEEGIFPHQNAFIEGDAGIEEERRLCYVGFTRAKERLYLTNSKKRMLYGKTTNNSPSRFISEIQGDVLETVNNNFREEKPFDKSDVYIDDDVEYQKGDIVMHTIYGKGVVLDVDEKIVNIAFAKNFGIRKLMKNHKSLKKI